MWVKKEVWEHQEQDRLSLREQWELQWQERGCAKEEEQKTVMEKVELNC